MQNPEEGDRAARVQLFALGIRAARLARADLSDLFVTAPPAGKSARRRGARGDLSESESVAESDFAAAGKSAKKRRRPVVARAELDSEDSSDADDESDASLDRIAARRARRLNRDRW